MERIRSDQEDDETAEGAEDNLGFETGDIEDDQPMTIMDVVSEMTLKEIALMETLLNERKRYLLTKPNVGDPFKK